MCKGGAKSVFGYAMKKIDFDKEHFYFCGTQFVYNAMVVLSLWLLILIHPILVTEFLQLIKLGNLVCRLAQGCARCSP